MPALGLRLRIRTATTDFTDSTALTGDRDALRERIRSDGYLFLRGVLDDSEVRALDDLIFQGVEKRGVLGQVDPIKGKTGSYNEAIKVAQATEAFHRLAHDQALTQLMVTLVGDDAYVHPFRGVRFIEG